MPTHANSTATPCTNDHSHGCACAAGWLKICAPQPDRADAVADHGEDDVPQERHPVLVERDEADDDEEVEVRLDAAAGEQHECDGAEHQPARDEERRPAAMADQVAENQAGQRGDHGLGGLDGGVAEHEREADQQRDVQEQHALEQPVAPVPRTAVERVAARQVGQEPRQYPTTTALPGRRADRHNVLHETAPFGSRSGGSRDCGRGNVHPLCDRLTTLRNRRNRNSPFVARRPPLIGPLGNRATPRRNRFSSNTVA